MPVAGCHKPRGKYIVTGVILGLIGENGAGKSTLMNILSGSLRPDSGEIIIDGTAHTGLTPKSAQETGVQIVHQELSLLPEMSVAENIFLGKEIRNRLGIIDKAGCEEKSALLLREFDINIPVKQKIAELSTAQKQLVEIAKSMVGEMRVLILDEPTSSLTDREMVYLKRILTSLKDKGVSIIFISHKLSEVKELCDKITVLRDGEVVRTEQAADFSVDEMVRSMVGRDINDTYTPSTYSVEGRPLLEIEGLCSHVYGDVDVKDFHLKVNAGEIVGMFGLIGSGRTEVIKSIYGLRPIQQGKIRVDGKVLSRNSPMKLISSGVGWVSEDRRHEGVCLDMSIKNNIAMPVYQKLSKFGIINNRELEATVDEYISRLAIKTSGREAYAQTLSGGNQQKVVLAKWLASDPKVLILDEPTRGIDIGSKSEIHRLIRRLRDDGMAVLVISSELPELFSLCDRFVVMREGQVSGELDRSNLSEITEENIMRMATIRSGNHE